MKALTLHEPWATLVACGFKEVETRSWYTDYRGPLAIHASLRKCVPTELSHVTFALASRGIFLPYQVKAFQRGLGANFGAVVATCNLVACLPAALVEYKAKQLKVWFEPRHGWEFERLFGNYESGRWAWILRDVVPVKPPSRARGMQKLWDWQPETASDVLGDCGT